MSRNGLGIYSLPATYNPVVTNTPITIAWANTTLADIASALSNSIASNGETAITANLPMATYRHTGVGNAAARTDYAAAGQIQDNSLVWGSTAGGTADALTITLAPIVTAYVAGQRFPFISGASPNATTTPTLNVNGVGAKTFVRKDGSALVAGDIPAATLCEAFYDGTNMRLNTNPTAGSSSITTLGTVTSGTWNATVITGQYGGTGVANTGKTITLGGNLVTSGAFASTFTMTNTTSVTFPTSGTLATLTGSETLTNKTLTAPVITTIVSGAGTSTLPTATGTLLSTAAAVTVAQGGTGLATLTANNVIIGNGSSNPTFVAPGTSGNVLTSNGTTWTSVAGGGNALTYLSTVTASASATVDIETTFDGTYDEYVLKIDNFVPDTNNVTPRCRLKVGGSYDTGANYGYSVTTTTSSTTVSNSTPTAQIDIAQALTGSGRPSNFAFYIHNPASTTLAKTIDWHGVMSTNAVAAVASVVGAGVNSSTSAMTGIRFFMSSGNITSGTFRLYGIKNS